MAQPPSYTRQYNFNDFQTTSPADPLPGVQVDNELNAAKTNLDGLNANIAKIQRDDGLLANQSVHKNALDVDVLALIGLSGYTVGGNWSAGNSYTAGTLVNFNDATYLATVAHTSGTVFATDKDAGKWILLANAAIDTSASAVDKFEGTGSQTVFTLSFTYTSNTDVLVFVNGALRNPGDDYSISGNQITFSTAPSTPSVSGNENVIIWGPAVTTIAAKNAAETAAGNASGFATAASNSAATATQQATLSTQNRTQTAADVVSTNADAATTTADRAQVNTDKGIVAADKAIVAADKAVVATDKGIVATDKGIVAADKAIVAADKAIVQTDKGIVAADKATVAADKALVAADKTAADNARIAAQTAQAAAEAALDTFDDRFLGAKNSDPATDNDGNPLIDGALYFDSVNDIIKVYDQTNSQWRELALSGTNQTNVNLVAGQISPTNNISTVAGAVGNIATVAGDISGSNNVGAVGGDITNVNNVAGALTAINNVASNLASVNNFGDTYFVGASAPSSPTLGDLWFDTGSNTMKVYGSGGFQNAGSSVNGTSNRVVYTVGTSSGSYAGSTTVFPAVYDAGFIDVYLNGIKLEPAAFTATNGTSVTLAAAAATGDIVDLVSFGTFQLSNFSIGNANDVDLTGQLDGHVLVYDSSVSDYVPSDQGQEVNLGGDGSNDGVSVSDGLIEMRAGGGNPAQIDMYCEVSNAHKVTIKAPPHAHYAGDVTFQLPSSNGINGQFLQTDGSGGLSYATPGNATTSAAGLMSAADKTKLDGVEASADVTDATNVAAAGAAMLSGAAFTGDVTVDTDTLKVDAANNRVGVQKAAPEASLHVIGDSTDLNNRDNVMLIEGGDGGGNRGIHIGQIGNGSQARMFLQGFHSQSISNYWDLCLNPNGGYVTVGTDEPTLFNAEGTAAGLTVAGSDTSTNTVGNGGAAVNIVQTNGTAGNTAGLHFSRQDTDGTPNYSGAAIVAQFPDAQVTGQYPKGKLHFNTSTTPNAAPSTKMTLDELGTLTIPNQPFAAITIANPPAMTTSGGLFTTGSVQVNSGNCWNSSSHRFTAPTAGIYMFIVTGYTTYTNQYGYISLYRNGSNYKTHHYNHNGHQQHSIATLAMGIPLSVNDFLELRRGGGGSGHWQQLYLTIYKAQ